MFYSAFDLKIKSEDIKLSELWDQNENKIKENIYDIEISKKNLDKWERFDVGNADTPFLQMRDSEFRLFIKDIACFCVKDGKNIFWDKLSESVQNNDIKAFLLSSVLGALLIQRDMLVLHGNALFKDGKLIVCLGQSGAGKSTISYCLMKNGWKIVADDLVAVTKEWKVLPGIPRIKLWQDSADYFNLNTKSLQKVRTGINKFLILKDELSMEKKSHTINRLYVVYPENKFENIQTNLNFYKINDQRNKFLILRNNIFRPRFVRGLCKEGSYFIHLSNIAREIPLYVFKIPNGLKKMEEVLISHFENI